MNLQLDVKLDDVSSKFSSYINLIEKMSNDHIEYIRDIKLNTLLDNKKVQYDIDDIRHLYGIDFHSF